MATTKTYGGDAPPQDAAKPKPKKRRGRKKQNVEVDEEAERQERDLRLKIAQSLHHQHVQRTEVEVEDELSRKAAQKQQQQGDELARKVEQQKQQQQQGMMGLPMSMDEDHMMKMVREMMARQQNQTQKQQQHLMGGGQSMQQLPMDQGQGRDQWDRYDQGSDGARMAYPEEYKYQHAENMLRQRMASAAQRIGSEVQRQQHQHQHLQQDLSGHVNPTMGGHADQDLMFQLKYEEQELLRLRYEREKEEMQVRISQARNQTQMQSNMAAQNQTQMQSNMGDMYQQQHDRRQPLDMMSPPPQQQVPMQSQHMQQWGGIDTSSPHPPSSPLIPPQQLYQHSERRTSLPFHDQLLQRQQQQEQEHQLAENGFHHPMPPSPSTRSDTTTPPISNTTATSADASSGFPDSVNLLAPSIQPTNKLGATKGLSCQEPPSPDMQQNLISLSVNSSGTHGDSWIGEGAFASVGNMSSSISSSFGSLTNLFDDSGNGNGCVTSSATKDPNASLLRVEEGDERSPRRDGSIEKSVVDGDGKQDNDIGNSKKPEDNRQRRLSVTESIKSSAMPSIQEDGDFTSSGKKRNERLLSLTKSELMSELMMSTDTIGNGSWLMHSDMEMSMEDLLMGDDMARPNSRCFSRSNSGGSGSASGRSHQKKMPSLVNASSQIENSHDQRPPSHSGQSNGSPANSNPSVSKGSQSSVSSSLTVDEQQSQPNSRRREDLMVGSRSSRSNLTTATANDMMIDISQWSMSDPFGNTDGGIDSEAAAASTPAKETNSASGRHAAAVDDSRLRQASLGDLDDLDQISISMMSSITDSYLSQSIQTMTLGGGDRDDCRSSRGS